MVQNKTQDTSVLVSRCVALLLHRKMHTFFFVKGTRYSSKISILHIADQILYDKTKETKDQPFFAYGP